MSDRQYYMILGFISLVLVYLSDGFLAGFWLASVLLFMFLSLVSPGRNRK
jgi:hypothetical protein